MYHYGSVHLLYFNETAYEQISCQAYFSKSTRSEICHYGRNSAGDLPLTEIPQLFVNIAVTRKYFDGSYLETVFEVYSIDAIMDKRSIWSLTLAYHTTYFSDIFPYNKFVDSQERLDFFLLLIEGMKVLTLFGCLSNFVIYITMSSKLRSEIRKIFLFK